MISFGVNKCKAFAYMNGRHVKLKKGFAYIGGAFKKVYSAGNIVTYHVDADVVYKEEVDSDASCLSPATFTPTMSGWTFLGWREDASASGEVLESMVMGDDPIELYAVYKKEVTLNYNGNGSTSGNVASKTMEIYCNVFGDTTKATAVLSNNGFGRSGYTFQKWAIGTPKGTKCDAGASISVEKNTTVYAVWKRDTAVLFDTNDETIYQWYRAEKAAQGWGLASDVSSEGILSPIDCTDYTTCTVRIRGAMVSKPSASTVAENHIRIGFTDNYEEAITVVTRHTTWRKSSAEEPEYPNDVMLTDEQFGPAYDVWYDLVLDVTELTGYRNLNVFTGGSYFNGAYLGCSKITMSAD